MNKLSKIKERHAMATPGPYMWDANKSCKSIELATAHSGGYYVMGFERWGMQCAQPTFQMFEKYDGPVRDRGSLGMAKAIEFAKPRKAHHPNFDMWIDHPDATALEKSWEDIDALLQINADLLEALKELDEYFDFDDPIEDGQVYDPMPEQIGGLNEVLLKAKKAIAKTEGVEVDD